MSGPLGVGSSASPTFVTLTCQRSTDRQRTAKSCRGPTQRSEAAAGAASAATRAAATEAAATRAARGGRSAAADGRQRRGHAAEVGIAELENMLPPEPALPGEPTTYQTGMYGVRRPDAAASRAVSTVRSRTSSTSWWRPSA